MSATQATTAERQADDSERANESPDAASRPLLPKRDVAFIDFGCGAGGSMRLGETICRAPGGGFGLDISAEQVAAAARSGLEAAQGDVLEFEERGGASVSLAVDLMPELENRGALERACLNIVRAARDFAVIQHSNFDSAEALLARGLLAPGFSAKAVRLRPRAIDYLQFVMQFGSRLDIVGFAAFGFGEPRTTAAPLSGIEGSLLSHAAYTSAHRSLRVIIARKAIGRFRFALERAGTGETMLFWQRKG